MRIASWLMILVLVLWWISTAFVQVDETQSVIITRLGKPVRTVLEAGLTYKWPAPIESAVRFDNRLQVLETPSAAWTSEEVLTKDKKNVILGTYTVWRIKRDPASLDKFLTTVRDPKTAQHRLADLVWSEVGATLGQSNFAALVTTDPSQWKWPDLVAGVQDRCARRALDAFGVELIDFQIQRVSFPNQNRGGVFERMRAERQRISSKLRSDGEKESQDIRARVDLQEAQIRSKADLEAARIHSEADAEAARIAIDAYGRSPEFYEFWRLLETYKVSFNEGAVLVLSQDNWLMQLFRHPPATQPTQTQAPGVIEGVNHVGE